jgi:hypothetical protein
MEEKRIALAFFPVGHRAQRPAIALPVSVCYVYAGKEEALRSSYMTHAEAVMIAEVKDLVAGSRFRFHEKGEYSLKGIEGRWSLYAVEA